MRPFGPFALTFWIAWGGFSAREAFAHRDSALLTVMWAFAGLGLILSGLAQLRALTRRPRDGAAANQAAAAARLSE